MKNIFLAIILIIGCETYNPPFRGTIFIDKDIITNADSSTFIDVLYTGIEQRTMFDRRVDDWVIMKPYLFDASFNDGLKCEIQVNPEFGNSDNALIEALRYGEEIGRLPTALRKDVETVWIHKGIKPYKNDRNILIVTYSLHQDYTFNNQLDVVPKMLKKDYCSLSKRDMAILDVVELI